MFSLEHSKFETSLGYPHVLHGSAVRYNVWCTEEKPDINMGIYLYINIYIYINLCICISSLCRW